MKRIGVADTTFARVDMAKAAIAELQATGTGFRVERLTVPGIKDLPRASLELFARGCDLVLALGSPGPLPVDKQSAQVASTGLMEVQVKTGKPILEVFVHADEAKDDREMIWLCESRAKAHARNAYDMLFFPDRLAKRAGQGVRQGFASEGPARGAPRASDRPGAGTRTSGKSR